MNNSKSKVVSGLFWTFLERISAQLVTTLVTIVLARILDPEHYGIISIITIFITLCNVFVTSGFGSAVISKKRVDQDDYDTAFTMSFIISIILYIVLFFSSPLVARFYNNDLLCPIMRVMSIRIILASFNSIQQAHIQKTMKFKLFFIATSFGTIVSAIVGVIMALKGFGAWALVAQYLTNTIIDSIVLAFADKWVPRLHFNKHRAKHIFGFGWKVLLTNLTFSLEADIRSLIVGKVFGAADLAFYDQGQKYPAFLVNNINSSINKVMLPAYSEKQENLLELKEMLRKTIRLGVFLLTPILIGFALVSSDFVKIILTEKWNSALPFINIFCIMYLTRPLETSCHQALLAVNRSGVVLVLMIIVSSFGLLTTLIAVFVLKSVLYIAIGLLITQVVSYLCFMGAGKVFLKYSFKEQFLDVYKVLISIITMSVIVILFEKVFSFNEILMFLSKILIGIIVYVLMSIITKNESLYYIKNKFLKKKFSN